jgi:RNA polymerase sigma-70 factor (ECF subfamily)
MPSTLPGESDNLLLAALRQRDESAFTRLVERYHTPMVRMALLHVGSLAVAEEVVQETWLGVLRGLETFEERSSFRTWLFRILFNRARSRGEREGRTVNFSSLGDGAGDPAVPAERFLPADHPEWPHHWALPPEAWGASPDAELLSRETLDLVARAIDALAPAQRAVITLRDVEGMTAEEACNVLGISETNQRVLLHRARSKVRSALEHHFAD